MKKIFALTILLSIVYSVYPQTYAKYWISFKDKEGTIYSIDQPEAFLSPRALENRARRGVPVTEQDLPISEVYVAQLLSVDSTMVLLTRSKWLNGVTIYTEDPSIEQKVAQLPFVNLCERTASLTQPEDFSYPRFTYQNRATAEALPQPLRPTMYGYSTAQAFINRVDFLHYIGATGQGMQIMVIDAGFENAHKVPHLQRMREEGRLLGVRNFVLPGKSQFESGEHGMQVLSCIASYIPNEIVGSAPDASFYLATTEDDRSENLVEVDNWVAAAEWADSLGCDIITSSLGYHIFDDTSKSYTFEDLDGYTSRASRAATIAAEKGILVCISAGNGGTERWHYVTPPADADKVLTVGAVDLYGSHASFSSWGETADGRVKPEVNAIGQNTVVAGANGATQVASGTSFACPLIAGMCACLWQSFPEITNMDILRVLQYAAPRSLNPSPKMGYGIPDFLLAYNYLQQQNSTSSVKIVPVRTIVTKSSVEVYYFSEKSKNVFVIEAISQETGKTISKTYYTDTESGSIMVKLPIVKGKKKYDLIKLNVIDPVSHDTSHCYIGMAR